MNGKRRATWLYSVVFLHLGLNVAHGAAHSRAEVPLSAPAAVFVYVVILIGPPAGIAVRWFARTTGAWTVALTMAAALVFGVANHFLIVSPDHVMHVNAQVRPLFASTAILLAVTEAAGAVLATRLALERTQP